MPKKCKNCGTTTLTDNLPHVTIKVDDNGQHDAEWKGTLCLKCVREKFPLVYDNTENEETA